MKSYNLIFVDCEGHGPAPTFNDDALFEFGAVKYTPQSKVSASGRVRKLSNGTPPLTASPWLPARFQLAARLLFFSRANSWLNGHFFWQGEV